MAAATGCVSRGAAWRWTDMEERQRYREVLAINRAIAGAEDYAEVLRLVVERTAAFTGASACVLLLSQEDGLARVVRSVGIDPAKAARLAAPLTERIDRELCELLAPESGHPTGGGVSGGGWGSSSSGPTRSRCRSTTTSPTARGATARATRRCSTR